MPFHYFVYHTPEELRERLERRMKHTGMTMAHQALWSEDEIQVLRALSPRYDLIQQRLKGRSFEAIRHKCNRLGISKTIHLWTGAEISQLRRLYPLAPKDEIIAAFPSSTWAQIKSTARRNGFRRDRPLSRLSGNILVDAVMRRCDEIGWSLADLDEECGTGRYFRRRPWRKGEPNMKIVLMAITVLGGAVRVDWV